MFRSSVADAELRDLRELEPHDNLVVDRKKDSPSSVDVLSDFDYPVLEEYYPRFHYIRGTSSGSAGEDMQIAFIDVFGTLIVRELSSFRIALKSDN